MVHPLLQDAEAKRLWKEAEKAWARQDYRWGATGACRGRVGAVQVLLRVTLSLPDFRNMNQ